MTGKPLKMEKTKEQTLLVQINQAKQDLFQARYDRAIRGFMSSIEISRQLSPDLSGITGICHSYLAVAYGKTGERQKILENLTLAEEAFSSETKNPADYAKIIRTIGKELQDMEYVDSSIFALRLALKLARKYEGDKKLDLVSVISRDLGLSYLKDKNFSSAAKLFRIAGDLEDDPSTAIGLYQNAAYLYFKENKRIKALNTLETAFNKAGIIGATPTQREIAQFQASISYDLFRESCENNSFDVAMTYGDICLEKLTVLNDTEWTVRIKYKQALIYSQQGQQLRGIQLLNEIASTTPTEQTEEYIINSNLLMTIHALESDKHAEASSHIKQISDSQINMLERSKPELAQKVKAIRIHLKRTQKRGQLSTNIRFSREKPELPLDELLQGGDPLSEDQARFSELHHLKAPILEVFTPSPEKPSRGLNPPTIESLHEVFKSAEDSQEETVRPITPSIVSQTPTLEKSARVDRSHLFKAHQTRTSPEPGKIQSTVVKSDRSAEVSAIEDVTHEDEEPTPETRDIRSEVITRLQSAGWAVRVNFIDSSRRTAEPDLIAEKGLIRKSRKLIFFAEDPTDAEICSFLLQSSQETGKKIVFLLSGDPLEANVSLKVKIFTQIDQLF